MKPETAEKIAEFIVEEAKRLSFLLACIAVPAAVVFIIAPAIMNLW